MGLVLRASAPRLVLLYVPAIRHFQGPSGPTNPDQRAPYRAFAERHGLRMADQTGAFV